MAKIVFIGAGSFGFTRKLVRGNEYAASIINAYLGGGPERLRRGPRAGGAETAGTDSRRTHPGFMRYPDGLTAQTEMMAVEGCLSGDRDLIFQAIAHDPLTACKLSLRETRAMVDEMFRRNKRFPPQFRI